MTASDLFLLMWDDYGWSSDIGALAILDGTDLLDRDGTIRIEAVHRHLEPRLHLVPRFRQLLYRPRLGLGWPLWVDASSFDLADHVRVHPLDAPGGQPQLLAVCRQLARRRLDPGRLLWELWLLPGMPDRRVGAFLRLHHALADGAAALAGNRLDLARQIAHGHQAKINDVVLAAVAGGLRRLLASRGEDVQGLVQRAMVTVSTHQEQPGPAQGNKPGWMMVPLPLGEPDPLRRLELIAAETAARKHRDRPEAGSGIFRFVAGQRVWYRHFPRQRSVNLVVTNVAGPSVPRYLAGARVLELFPVMPVMGNLTLVVAVVSYAGQLNLTAVADPAGCPDVTVFAEGVSSALDDVARSVLAALATIGSLVLRGRHGDAAEALLRSPYTYRDGGSAWDAFPPEWRRVARENAKAALNDFRNSIGTYPSATDLASVEVPVVCSYGARRPNSMAGLVRSLAAAIPGGTTRRIDGAGHAAPFDATANLVQLVAETVAVRAFPFGPTS